MNMDFVFALFILFAYQKKSQSCPDECHCVANQHNLTMTLNCSYQKLTSFPSFLTMTFLNLSNSSSGRKPNLHNIPETPRPQVQLLVNGNAFTYLLRNKLAPIAQRLVQLEIGNNQYPMEFNGGLLSDLASPGILEILRLGPLQGDICSLLRDAFQNLPRLTTVSVTGASQSLDDNSCILNADDMPSKLRSLSMSHIGNSSVEGVPKETLALEHLQLIGLEMSHPPLLVSAVFKTTLKHLDLSHNELTSLWQNPNMAAFSQECVLEILNVSYNRLTTIEPGALENCQHLKNLDISHNPISNFPECRSLPTKSPLTLDLSTTKVSSLNAFCPSQISVLKMFEAGLECSCKHLAPVLLDIRRQNLVVQGTCHQTNSIESSGELIKRSLGQLLEKCSDLKLRLETAVTRKPTSNSKLKYNATESAPSPLACVLCTLACLLHGTLIYAVVFASKNRNSIPWKKKSKTMTFKETAKLE